MSCCVRKPFKPNSGGFGSVIAVTASRTTFTASRTAITEPNELESGEKVFLHNLIILAYCIQILRETFFEPPNCSVLTTSADCCEFCRFNECPYSFFFYQSLPRLSYKTKGFLQSDKTLQISSSHS